MTNPIVSLSAEDAAGRDAAELVLLQSLVTSVTETERAIAALQAFRMQLFAAGAGLAEEQMSRVTSRIAREREMPLRSIAAEFGTALRRSDRVVQHQLADAHAVATRFSATLDALGAGRIDLGHVHAIVDAGARLDDAETRAAFEQAALDVAERETVGRAKPIIAMLAQRVHPTTFDERHRTAAQGRRVWTKDLEDGMAELGVIAPAELVHAIYDRLTRFARSIVAARPTEGGGVAAGAAAAEKPVEAEQAADGATAAPAAEEIESDGATADESAGAEPVIDGTRSTPTAEPPRDTRTTDQLRADVLADLLLTGHATAEISNASLPEADAIVAHVQVTIPASLLADEMSPGVAADAVQATDAAVDAATLPAPATATHDIAQLDGHGAMNSDFARRVACRASGWDRLFLQPATGTLVLVDRYRPSGEQRRLLRARDEHCRFPGCRMPTYRCDVDHTIDAAHGGPTDVCNLAHLCRRHHTLKHHTAWSVRQLPGGILEWTSPLGHIHVDAPARTLAFIPASDPPPF